eukprot:COSAG05_NODE_1452_length_4847_cov_3.384794_4_plen_52_part_00
MLPSEALAARAGGISVADLGDPPVVNNLVHVGDAARSLGGVQQDIVVDYVD